MSDDIPKAPPNLRIYSFIRGLLSPQHTIKYLLVESLIMCLLLLSVLYYSTTIIPIVYGLIPAYFILIWASMYLSTESGRRDHPEHVMQTSSVFYILLGAIFIAAILGYGYIEESISLTHYIATIGIGVHMLSVMMRSSKYKGQRDYFTDQYSNVSKDWERASVALEQALDSREDSTLKSYYWAKRAESIYEDIIEEEERIMEREAAGAFAAASSFLAVSIFTKSNESYTYWKAAESSIEQAMEFLSVRVCDNCGRKQPVENCSETVTDGERMVICQQCIQREKKRSQRSQKTEKRTSGDNDNTKKQSQRATEKQKNSGNQQRKTRNQNKYGNKSNNESNSSKSQTSESQSEKKSRDHREPTRSSGSLTKDEALELLGLNSVPEDTEKIHEAFRKKVKEAHPDMGGSQEKFKKVKKAREVLVNE